MAYDKFQAIKKNYRVSEKTFLLFAFCFGALGILLAMFKPVSHKKNKIKFFILIPIFLILNIAMSYLLLMKLV